MTIANRRRSWASANAPAHAPSTSIGRNWQATAMPTAVASPVNRNTSRDIAVSCSQVPTFETARPPKKSRAFR